MYANAILLEKPGHLALASVRLAEPGDDDLVVQAEWSSISSGTERLLWEGRMPDFPGMGYPLVPGYETVGTVVDAGPSARNRIGEKVFVPGTRGYVDVRPLFGGAASLLVANSARAIALPEGCGEEGVLLALAATAWRAVARNCTHSPALIVGHGVLGRLTARIAMATGGPAPLVWEANPARRAGATGYEVAAPDAPLAPLDARTVLDASGDPAVIDAVIRHVAKRGEIVLAGFYEKPVSFAFPPAFMREASIRISAEFEAADVAAVSALVADGLLSLDGLITHRSPADDAEAAYRTAFGDPACLKMALDWRSMQ